MALVLAASATASCGGGPTDDGDSDGPGGAGPDSGGSENDSGGSSSDETGGSGSDETGGTGSDEAGGGPNTGGNGTDESGGSGNSGGGSSSGGGANSGGSSSGGEQGVGGQGGGFGGEGATGGSGGTTPLTEFVTVWNTAATSPDSNEVGTLTSDKTILLPLVAAGSYAFTVDWGDGTTSEVTSPTDPDREHVYAEAGTYVVSILGTLQGWHFPYQTSNCGGDPGCTPLATSDAWKLLEVQAWGSFRFGSTAGAFEHCTNLVITATDEPDLSAPVTLKSAFAYCPNVTDIPSINEWDVSAVTDMSHTFYYSGFNGDLSAWNTSNVTTMARMFAAAEFFDGDISAWDTANVVNMSRMFADAASFDGDISGWNTAKVRTMRAMFAMSPFNQDISGWNTSKLTNTSYMFDQAAAFNQDLSAWNTSLVTSMAGMFTDAVSFNQDISAWDTSAVTDMREMFLGATAFDQDLSGWDIGSVTTAASMFATSGLSTSNYDALLNGWAAQSTQSNVPFGAGTTQYTTAAGAARAILIGQRDWIVSDGGLAP